jgi:hypothetical protein
MSYNPHFDIDLAYGERGERTVREVLDLQAHRIEVKTSRYGPSKVFVEVAHLPRGAAEYQPSGVSVTEATFMAFTYGSAVFAYPTDVIRAAVQRQSQPPIDAGLAGDNPTKGYLISTWWLAELAQARGVDP